MFRKFAASKDTYITDRVIRGARAYGANLGLAGTLDLFKLYGVTLSGTNPNAELSRILIKFDITDLKTDYAAGKIDITHPSFNCAVKLFDVYGGQPTPKSFKLRAYPLSQSFDEGLGRDVVFYQDTDTANFYTASYADGVTSLWFLSGANSKGLLGSSDLDVISSGNLGAGMMDLWVTQSFSTGVENLVLDVTDIVSATLCDQIPDHGYRISYDESAENDTKTYFVKRFGSSQAADPYVRPCLIVKYDDSVISNESNFTFDSPGTLFLYNFVRGNLTNIVSGTSLTQVTGSDCLLLSLTTPVSTSSGFVSYETVITASQHRAGINYVTGVYSASFTLASAISQFSTKIAQSGSVKFDQNWKSLDGTVTFFTDTVTISPPQAATGPSTPKRYYLNITNIATEYLDTDIARMKVFIFDYSNPVVTVVRTPVETPSVVVERAYYSIRDEITNEVVIPFDTTYNSTKLSADSSTMYFDLWMSNLVTGRSYTVDILLDEGGQQQIYRDIAPAFRVVEM